MSCSLIEHGVGVERQLLEHPVEDERTAADDVGAARVHERQGAAVGDRHLRQRQAGRPQLVDRQPGAVDGVAVVGREAEGVRRHRRDGAGDADDRRDRLEPVHEPAPAPSRGGAWRAVTSATGGGSLGRKRSVSRTEPMSRDVDHSTSAPSPSTSSVEPPPMSTTSVRAGLEAAGGADEGRQRLLLAGEHLRPDAEDRLDRVRELVGVLGVACGRGGAEPDAVGAQHRDQLGVLAGGLQRAVDRLVGQTPGGVDALAEAHDAHLPHVRL